MGKSKNSTALKPIEPIEGEDSNAEEVEQKSYMWIYVVIFVVVIVLIIVIWVMLSKIPSPTADPSKTPPDSDQTKTREVMEVDDTWCTGKATAKSGVNLSAKSLSGTQNQ